ncbi:ABC transporter permease [Jeotgalibacillus terrae]|uniref:ABC transporter permease n=1 Tax=Jeotgalibacillus terrae TaxID=587735 RepID=A0ABW5ZLP5_9BACL|nr:ABC transporter permease subunit [Jeotgalibacillus terrae]MBM7578134.1 ABC-type transport system involved in multi-copper enzyme maturation permease subunit [Jeotgalibacillus terrae]
MFAISKREFLRLMKGIKSIIIIAILLITAYFSAKFSSLLLTLDEFTASEADIIHTAGFLVLLLFFGQLFVMGLSHDVMNREMHDRTIRFLVTRTSRLSIVLGKFLGVSLFWFTCVAVSFLIVFFFSHSFDWLSFLQLMSLLIFQIALTILLSVLIPKPGFTMFLGVIVGLASPILGFWLTLTNNPWVSWLKFATPYYYLEEDYTFPIILVLAAVLLAVAHLVFQRREC